MKNRDIQKKLRTQKIEVQIDEKKKEETMRILQSHIAEKQIGVLQSRRRILWGQIRYMDKSVFAVHMLFCIMIAAVGVFMNYKEAPREDIIVFSMILAGILGVVSIVQTGRIFSSGIAELSESCYFNVKQIVAFHMVLSDIINLTFLLFGIFFVGIQWKVSLIQIGLYILVPFVITQCCCLGALLTEAGRKNPYVLIMVGVFAVVFYLVIALIPELYRVTGLTIWCAAFVIGVLLLGIQIKTLFRGIERGNMICTN
ncbi:MAG: hypothetical protein NC231_06335 [Bacillus sp. (in: Bacteria)]|nr:hypothetical protein [Bacillus sp. (in: firmicutes)]MCM1426597.1 hypothetical protein [Eubacterium sp.]